MQEYAAKIDHKHSAADITSGTLTVARGGTGVATVTGTGTQGKVFASGTSTAAAAPTWRAISAADLPSDFNRGSATKLQTARTFQTNLAQTTAVAFDGTANNLHGVTGVLPVANGGIPVIVAQLENETSLQVFSPLASGRFAPST
ncbi:hypothetical protein FACS1894184_17030 [Clostridia bacterium]|nr:hypothetical protein FACS1894184_17030 [Clostridia bacterium]